MFDVVLQMAEIVANGRDLQEATALDGTLSGLEMQVKEHNSSVTFIVVLLATGRVCRCIDIHIDRERKREREREREREGERERLETIGGSATASSEERCVEAEGDGAGWDALGARNASQRTHHQRRVHCGVACDWPSVELETESSSKRAPSEV